MKNLFSLLFTLLFVTLVACSDDSSSSKVSKVSCKMTLEMEDEDILYVCYQTTESYRADLEENCVEPEDSDVELKVTLEAGGCDEKPKKECSSPEGELQLFVYDKTLAKNSCEELMEDDEDEDDDENSSKIDSSATLGIYNPLEEKCAQGKLYANDIEVLFSLVIEDYATAKNDTTIINQLQYLASDGKVSETCENFEEEGVQKEYVLKCVESDADDAIVLYYYDESFKEKTCEELGPFASLKED